VQPCLRKQVMSSSSDAHSRDGAGAASVGVVLPKLLPLGAAAENGFPAEDEVVDSLTLKLAKTIRSLALQRYIVKKIKTDLTRKLKNARKSLKRLNQKAKAVRACGPLRDANHKERCDRHERGQRAHRRCR